MYFIKNPYKTSFFAIRKTHFEEFGKLFNQSIQTTRQFHSEKVYVIAIGHMNISALILSVRFDIPLTLRRVIAQKLLHAQEKILHLWDENWILREMLKTNIYRAELKKSWQVLTKVLRSVKKPF